MSFSIDLGPPGPYSRAIPRAITSTPSVPAGVIPYGMRIIRRDLTFWHQGTATTNNDGLLLCTVCQKVGNSGMS
jgi:hypothetical protein